MFVFCGHEAAGFDLENSRDEIPLKTFNFLIEFVEVNLIKCLRLNLVFLHATSPISIRLKQLSKEN